MSEIIKLYENAGINKIGIKRCSGIKQGICQHNCNECENFDYKYPPFTAEKQLAILCWLVNLNGSVEFNNKPKDITPERVQEALAYVINSYWAKLTPEQQQQIKEILE